MEQVLVTGGAGYIGAELCALLLRSGCRVTLYDSFLFGRGPIAPLTADPGLKVVEGDIRDREKLRPLLKKGMAIVHLASLSNDPSCDLDPRWSVSVNHDAALQLAVDAKSAGCERLLFASSCSVYGFGGGAVLTETSPLNPVSLYARLKTQTEEALFALADDRFSPVILRQATIFGLSARMRFDLAINQMTLHALTRGKIFVLGGGRQWRPFLHVRDAALAFRLALEAPRKAVHRQIFNSGSNENNFQIAGLADRVQREIGNVEIEVAPEDADRRDYNVDFSRIHEVLGFRPQVDVSQGIREVAAFIRQDISRDYNTGDFFNIKRMKEVAERPAISGGEPVRYSMLSFPSITAMAFAPAVNQDKKRGMEHFDFTRAGEALEILLASCRLKRGNTVLVGTACDGWLLARLRKMGLKTVPVSLAPDSYSLSAPALKKKLSGNMKAVFFSEFDGPKAVAAAGKALKFVFTSVPTSLKGDAVIWKCDVAPGIAGTPAARVTVSSARLAGGLRKEIALWGRNRIETPTAGPGITAEFNRLSKEAGRLEEITRKLSAAVNGGATAGDFPPGRMGIVFNTAAEMKRFIDSALAERIDCLPLPEGWKAPSGARNLPRAVFLPVSQSSTDGDVSDIARALRKLELFLKTGS